MIGANDLFIAAHARSLGLTLVTNNTREFGRVSRLVIENWTVGAWREARKSRLSRIDREQQARIARQADRDFGKMSGHPAIY